MLTHLALFIIMIGLLLVISSCILGQELPKTVDDSATPQPRYDWGIVYYMSYDNNLDTFGAHIITQIEEGIKSCNVVAAVQADFTEDKGMQRYAITSEGTRKIALESEDSADAGQVLAYLQWFVANFPCRKYIFTFLNHGGKVDEMCYDRNPQTEGKHWISGHVLGRKLRKFIIQSDLNVELLFLQQCGRGSIENLYSFRGTANYVMSSPINVGAPNTYYSSLQRWLSNHTDATGEAIARKIAEEDRDFMIYTCARGEKFDELTIQLNRAIQPFLEKKNLRTPKLPRVIYSGGNESVVDLCAYLKVLSESNENAGAIGAAFCKWLDSDFFINIHFKSSYRRLRESYCGLSIFVPSHSEDIERYGYLDLYKDSKLALLWKKLVEENSDLLAP